MLRHGCLIPRGLDINWSLGLKEFLNGFSTILLRSGIISLWTIFTVTAQRFGGNILVGAFDPVKNVLLFDGLEYVPELPIPEVSIKASNDLINWIDVSEPKTISRGFNWGDSVVVSFDRKGRGSEYFLIEINTK